jgi:sulfur-oxidizing protein SoxY
MTITLDGFPATRRLILKGAGAVALFGFGGFSLGSALAGANDKYPEDAFKQKSDADAIKPRCRTRSSSTRPKSPRTARWFRSR